MDVKAHTILGGVIASHGEKLITSNAFCNVYLTGYLAEYPEEKRLLIALKVMELPAALLAYKKDELPETALLNCIRQIIVGSDKKADDISWGVDAWAEAIGVSRKARHKIQQQCFPENPKKISNASAMLMAGTTEAVSAQDEVPMPVLKSKSRLGVGTRIITGTLGLMIIQVFAGNNPLKHPSNKLESAQLPPQYLVKALPVTPVSKIPTPDVSIPVIPVRKELIITKTPRAFVDKIPPASVLQQATKQIKHKPVQIIAEPRSKVQRHITNLSPEEYRKKSERLLAETEAFLIRGH